MKPLTTYKPYIGHDRVFGDPEAEMRRDYYGRWYAKDEADAVIRELEAERDAARADAERYRWIRSDKCYWVSIQAQPYGDEIYKGGPFDALDAAIDAARGAE
ncbi:MAG: hypothetical protein ACK5PF_09620 [bacterium]